MECFERLGTVVDRDHPSTVRGDGHVDFETCLWGPNRPKNKLASCHLTENFKNTFGE